MKSSLFKKLLAILPLFILVIALEANAQDDEDMSSDDTSVSTPVMDDEVVEEEE